MKDSLMKLSTIPLLFSATIAASPAAPFLEEELKATDQKKLGKEIAAYFEAKAEEKGIAEALEGVDEAIEKLNKKLKGRSVLSMVDDLERAVFYANDYGKKRVSKGKGRVDDMPIEHPFFGEFDIAIHAPKTYDGDKGPYGMVLSIPDEGEDPKAHLTEDWADADARKENILVSFYMPKSTDMWEELGELEAAGGVGLIMASLGELVSNFAIDMDRVYICGSGRGVPVAAKIASLFPHVFAGLMGRGGDLAEGTDPTNFQNIPTLFAGGGGNCTDFEAAVKEAGFDNCTIQPGAGESDLWAWMGQHIRNPVPSRVSFAPTTFVSNSAYWLQLEAFEPGNCRVEAVVDRDNNTIEVTGEGVSNLRIYFNDQLVDMDKPVMVTVNGAAHKEQVPRNFQVMLANAFQNGDTGRVFTNSVSYTVGAVQTQ